MGYHASTRVRLIALGICGFFVSCSSRMARPGPAPSAPSDQSVLAIPRDTAAERMLNKYKLHYEQFRHIESRYSNLSIQQEALLSEDYANARDAFNYWLWFVTDRVKAQFELEPPGFDMEPGKHPTHRHYIGEYRSRATEAASAIRKFDSDLNNVLYVRAPSDLSSISAKPYSLGYDIVHAFALLERENARIAGDELMASYCWLKQ